MIGKILLFGHVVGIILWLGASIGAGVSYFAAARAGEGAKALGWFEKAIRLEHVGLALTLATGVGLLLFYGYWPPSGWIAWKLALVAFVVVPLEAADLWVAHVWLPRALRVDPEAARARFDRWLLWGGAPVFVAALAILALATIKPPS